MITSVHNPRIKWVRLLQSQARERREAGAFIVEGVRLAEEAFQAGWEAQLVLHTEDLGPRGAEVAAGFAGRGAPVETVTNSVMEAASDTQTPQGILVVLARRSLPAPARPDFVFIPDGVRDPGNLGAMLRTAAAAGVQAVWVPPGAADVIAPKVVRAAMGAHFRLPVLPLSWDEIGEQAKANGLRLYLAEAGGELAYNQVDWRQPAALVVGGEAEGAGETARRLAHARVTIPMAGGMESLNAAAAAAILLFEAVRQRAGRKQAA